MASILLTYGLALAGLSFILQQFAPTSAKVSIIVGMAGGALSVFWGICALAFHLRRTWAVLTVVLAAIVLLTQVVGAFFESLMTLPGLVILALMFVITLGALLYLFHGERSADFYDSKRLTR